MMFDATAVISNYNPDCLSLSSCNFHQQNTHSNVKGNNSNIFVIKMSHSEEDNFYITIHYFSTKTSIHISHSYTHLVCNTSYTNNIFVSVNGMAPILDPQKWLSADTKFSILQRKFQPNHRTNSTQPGNDVMSFICQDWRVFHQVSCMTWMQVIEWTAK